MKTLILLLLFISLHAIEYDNLLLRAQSSLFPKILLLDKNIDEKVTDSVLKFSIVYEEEESKVANRVKSFIKSKYNGLIGKYKLKVSLLNINDFTDLDNSSAYYFLDLSGDKKQDIISHAVKNSRICFSYDYKDFDKKTLISLFLKEKTYIYLNKSVVNDYNVKFNPVFYTIAKVR